MRQSVSTVRVLSYALLAVAVAAGTTGCFKRGVKGDYALAPEMRPLEVPPDLNLPNATSDNKVPTLASATKPAVPVAAAPAVGNTGFTIAGGKDEAFAKVGTALEGVEGVTIASRAQLLGSYDVAYEGSNFLVRVVAVDAGAYISAVDPRGLPVTAEAPVKLIAALKAKLAQSGPVGWVRAQVRTCPGRGRPWSALRCQPRLAPTGSCGWQLPDLAVGSYRIARMLSAEQRKRAPMAPFSLPQEALLSAPAASACPACRPIRRRRRAGPCARSVPATPSPARR